MIEKAPVSVLIPVKNEAQNIEKCLRHLQWADEIIVVDSQSTDGTISMAEHLGAKIVQFYFNGTYPKKKNWALENLPFKHEWVLIVDADEVIPEELQEEIKRAIQKPKADGYYLHFAYMFLGREIKYCGYGSTWVLRLFKHRQGRYEKMPISAGIRTGDNEAHEHVILKGTAARLTPSVLHYAYPSIDTWVEKHNRYSNWEAELYDQFISGAFRKGEKNIGLPQRFKRKLKSLYLRLPFRYIVRFIYAYFIKLGFLDGKPGFILCGLLSFYDYLSWAKVQECRFYEKSLGNDNIS